MEPEPAAETEQPATEGPQVGLVWAPALQGSVAHLWSPEEPASAVTQVWVPS
jgi:hypothetical protein